MSQAINTYQKTRKHTSSFVIYEIRIVLFFFRNFKYQYITLISIVSRCTIPRLRATSNNSFLVIMCPSPFYVSRLITVLKFLMAHAGFAFPARLHIKEVFLLFALTSSPSSNLNMPVRMCSIGFKFMTPSEIYFYND